MEFVKYTYHNGNLAIGMRKKGAEYEDIISVNLIDYYTPLNCVFLDTNNYPNITKIVEQNGIGEDTGYRGRSGFCQYPLFKINIEKLIEA